MSPKEHDPSAGKKPPNRGADLLLVFESAAIGLGTPIVLGQASAPPKAFLDLSRRLAEIPAAAFALGNAQRALSGFLEEQAKAWTLSDRALAGAAQPALEIPSKMSDIERVSWERAISSAIAMPTTIVPAESLEGNDKQPIIARIDLVDSDDGLGRQQNLYISDAIFASGNRQAMLTLLAGAVGSMQAPNVQGNPLANALLDWALRNEPAKKAVNDIVPIRCLDAAAKLSSEILQKLTEIDKFPAYPEDALAAKVSANRQKKGEDAALLQLAEIAEASSADKESRPPGTGYSVLSRTAARLADIEAPRHVVLAALALELSPETLNLKRISGPLRNDPDIQKALDLAAACRCLNLKRFNPTLPEDPSLPDYTLQYSWDRWVQTVSRVAADSKVEPVNLLSLWAARKLECMHSEATNNSRADLIKAYDEIRFFAAPALQRIGESALAPKLLDTWSLVFPAEDRMVESQKAILTQRNCPERAAFAAEQLARIREVLVKEYGLSEDSFTLKFREKPNYSAFEKSIDLFEQKQKSTKPEFPGDVRNQTDLLSLELALKDNLPKDIYEDIKLNIHQRAGLGVLVGTPNDRGKWMRESLRWSDEATFFYELQIGTEEHFRQTKLGSGAPRKSEEKHLHMKVKRAYDNCLRGRLGLDEYEDFPGAVFNHSDPEMTGDIHGNFKLLAESLEKHFVHVQLRDNSRNPALFEGATGYTELRFPKGSISADLLVRAKGEEFADYRLVRVHEKTNHIEEKPAGTGDPLKAGQVFSIDEERRTTDSSRVLVISEGERGVKSVRARLVLRQLSAQDLDQLGQEGRAALTERFGEQTPWLTKNIYRPLQARSHLETLDDFFAAVGSKLISIEDIERYHDERFAKVEIKTEAVNAAPDEFDPERPAKGRQSLSVSISSNAGPIVREILDSLSQFKLYAVEGVVLKGKSHGAKEVILDLAAEATDDRGILAERAALLEAHLKKEIKRERSDGPSGSSLHRRSVDVLIDMSAHGALARVVGELNRFGAEVSEMRLRPEEEFAADGRVYSLLEIEVLGPGRSDSKLSEENRAAETERLEEKLRELGDGGVVHSVEVNDIASGRQLNLNII